MDTNTLSDFVKNKRRVLKLTQPQLATKAGVGLRFIRELENGKPTLRMDKANQVLKLFGHKLGPTISNRTHLGQRVALKCAYEYALETIEENRNCSYYLRSLPSRACG